MFSKFEGIADLIALSSKEMNPEFVDSGLNL